MALSVEVDRYGFYIEFIAQTNAEFDLRARCYSQRAFQRGAIVERWVLAWLEVKF